jgi:hypothetical protein
LFNKLNATDPDLKVPLFPASAGWFKHFNVRHGFQNLKLTGNSCQSTNLGQSSSAVEPDFSPVIFTPTSIPRLTWLMWYYYMAINTSKVNANGDLIVVLVI